MLECIRVKNAFDDKEEDKVEKTTVKDPFKLKIYEKSRTGFIPIGPETGYRPKSNQDAFMTIEDFWGVSNQYFLGVFDGHGLNGQKVSKFIKKRLPKNIKQKSNGDKGGFVDKIANNYNQMIPTNQHNFRSQFVSKRNSSTDVTELQSVSFMVYNSFAYSHQKSRTRLID